MTGVLDGLEVLDLSWGIAGPMAGMLLADHGAQVTKSSRRAATRSAACRVRGCGTGASAARCSTSHDPSDRDRVPRARGATPTCSSRASRPASPRSSASTTTRCWRATRASSTARSPATATTARTPTVPRSTRSSPPAPATVGERGVPGGTLARLAGVAPHVPRASRRPTAAGWRRRRPGPLFPGVPWVSLAAGVPRHRWRSAPRCARARSPAAGSGVETSLLQGVLVDDAGAAWQRVEHPDSAELPRPGSSTRAPTRVSSECADGRWIHQWVPLPGFVLGAAEGDRPLRITDDDAGTA